MTAETDALLEKAERSLHAARILLQEELPDFAASRAYYALFYVAEALLLEEGHSFSKHSAVISAFGREFVRGGDVPPRFHRYLLDAADLRTLGDYGTGAEIAPDRVREILVWGQEFLHLARERLQEQ